MKRFALILGVALGLALSNNVAHASWGACCYSGYQPWYNIFAHRHCKTCEEVRLEHFWHDYYDALKNYYCALDHIDWVAYYKNHGYQINAGCGGGSCGGGNNCCRINYAPVFVAPTMQWAVPSSCMNGPPTGGPCGPMAGGACCPMPGGPGCPMPGGPGGPMPGGPGGPSGY